MLSLYILIVHYRTATSVLALQVRCICVGAYARLIAFDNALVGEKFEMWVLVID